jgi:hypothetical protein
LQVICPLQSSSRGSELNIYEHKRRCSSRAKDVVDIQAGSTAART